MTRTPLRYFGGKCRDAARILRLCPALAERPHYVEPFGGSAGVLLQRPEPNRGGTEVYNDLDGDVSNFFRTLRDPDASARLVFAVQATPFSRDEFESAYRPVPAGHPDRDVERARRLCVRAHQAFGSAGATRGGRSGWRGGVVRSRTTPVDDWNTLPPVLAATGDRLRRAAIENDDALSCLRRHATRRPHGTAVYADPPYRHGERVTTAAYRHEMDDADHVALLDCLRDLDAEGVAVALSGYPSDHYAEALDGWRVETWGAQANGRAGASARTEALWISPSAAAAPRRPEPAPLFA